MKSYEEAFYEPAPKSHWPARIAALAGVFFILVRTAAIYLPGYNNLYVHNWPYLALELLPLLCFLAALFLVIYRRIRKDGVARVVLIVGISLLCFILLFLGAFCYSVEQLGEHPVAYYSSPEGTRRIVVMKSQLDEEVSTYSFYPMVNRYFYTGTAGQSLETNTGIEEVRWLSENVANVYLMDRNGVEVQMTVDFNNPVDTTLEEAEPSANP